MAATKRFRCIEKTGAQYRTKEGKVLFVHFGEIVETNTIVKNKKDKYPDAWEEVTEKPEKADFKAAAPEKTPTE